MLAWFVKMARELIEFMKKIITLLLLATSVASVSHAQLQKGNVLVGGDLANFNIGLKKNTGYNIQIDPKAAWFINNNIAVGAYVQFGIQKSNKQSPTETTYGIGALGRYYAAPNQLNTDAILKHARLFLEGNIGIEGDNKSNGGGSTNGLGIGIGPGVAYFIAPNIGLETLLKYNGILGFGDATTQSNLNLSIGFQVYLPGKATKNKVMKDANM